MTPVHRDEEHEYLVTLIRDGQLVDRIRVTATDPCEAAMMAERSVASEKDFDNYIVTPIWISRLRRLGACSDAIEWASEYPSLDAAWAACERGDWMLWWAGRVSGPPDSESRRRLVAAACECARLSLPVWERHYPEDRTPHVALETAERWTRGEATLEEVRSAAADAAVAADAAYADDDAAYVACDAAASAAYAADDAADAADAAYVACDAAAYASVLRECADIVRRHYPEPPACRPRERKEQS